MCTKTQVTRGWRAPSLPCHLCTLRMARSDPRGGSEGLG
ncbi:hypothetical protein E2C01_036172 [Portunus trituberculatus]|uniref:Uncharacterized protein n=1 Tax=Portunus trituberculatus TaxID=210409 RepID=A0A5B7FBS2_PORTR|nr:hypothetical protein [Portunus trituberculatus]